MASLFLLRSWKYGLAFFLLLVVAAVAMLLLLLLPFLPLLFMLLMMLLFFVAEAVSGTAAHSLLFSREWLVSCFSKS